MTTRKSESAGRSHGRTTTPPDLVRQANELQRSGALAGAAEIYLRILAQEPNHVDALQFLGVLRHREGRSKEGLRLIKRALRLRPDLASLHANAGKVMSELGLLDEAAAAYRRAISLDPQGAPALGNLAALEEKRGAGGEAEALYRLALAADGSHLPSRRALFALLATAGRIREALDVDAAGPGGRSRMAESVRKLTAYYTARGMSERAAAAVGELLAHDPENPVAQHLKAAISGLDVPDRASDAYVATTFDGFAKSFDEKLKTLNYRAPEAIGEAVRAAFPPADGTLHVLDAGCGTGLCGPYLRPFAGRLSGVDLSPRMLEMAALRSEYDELVCAELVGHLVRRPGAYDLIVSADTLCYFGALDGFAAAGHAALKPAGTVIFTVEHAAGPDAPKFELGPHGRYAHSRAYVLSCLGQDGFDVVSVEPTELRQEAGAAVDGLTVTARKRPAS